MTLDVAREWDLSPAEAGRLAMDELRERAAHAKLRREEDDRKWDLRFLGLCHAIAAFAGFGSGGRVKFDAAHFFPSLFKDAEEVKAPSISQREEMEGFLKSFAAVASGRTKQQEQRRS